MQLNGRLELLGSSCLPLGVGFDRVSSLDICSLADPDGHQSSGALCKAALGWLDCSPQVSGGECTNKHGS